MLIKSITGFSGCCLVPSPFHHHAPAYIINCLGNARKVSIVNCQKVGRALETVRRQVLREWLSYSYQNQFGLVG